MLAERAPLCLVTPPPGCVWTGGEGATGPASPPARVALAVRPKSLRGHCLQAGEGSVTQTHLDALLTVACA